MKTYTFYVGTAPEGEVVSRTIELPAAWTLDDLHDAIQEAFGLHGQAGFSFYMSGEAWDEESEYTHLDEIEDDAADANDAAGADDADDADDDEAEALMWEIDDKDEADEADEAAEAEEAADIEAYESEGGAVAGPLETSDSDEHLEPGTGAPSARDIRAMFAELKTNPELRAQLTAQLADQLKLPSFMLDAVLSNADTFLKLMPDESLNQMLEQGLAEMTGDQVALDGGPLGDTRETTIEELKLAPDQSFLYVYDDDLERYFDVQVESVQERDLPEQEFPRVLESIGELPPPEAEQDAG